MRLFRRLLIAAAALLVVAAAIGSQLIGTDAYAADHQPGRLETAVARRLVLLSIPRARRTAANPYASDDAGVRAGADHFASHCAVCHGDDGRGHSAIGGAMYPPVPDLASAEMQQFSDGALFSIIRNGVRWTGMPAFRSTHSDEETWQLVSFIRRMPSMPPAAAPAHHTTQPPHASAGHGARAIANIVMDGTRFQPDEVTVAAGEVVSWINKDPFPHNVASTAGRFHSGDMAPDASWQFRPGRKGTFRYVCTLHPGMTAVLHVR
jgi:plastocyanin